MSTLTLPAPDHIIRADLRTRARAWEVEHVMRAALGDERYDADACTVTADDYARMRYSLTLLSQGAGHLIVRH